MKHSPTKSAQRFTIMMFLLAGSLLLAACGGSTLNGSTLNGSAATAATNEGTTAATAEATSEASATATTEAATEMATEATTEATTEAATGVTAEAAATEAPAVQKLNLNEVTGEQLLATIPNFGDRMVREFQEYRPYVSIQQFRKEIGKYVDETQVAEYEKYVYVPINANAADEATLQQLPGVDTAAAAQLVAGRPYTSNAAFLERLAQVAPQSDATTAAAYLEGE